MKQGTILVGLSIILVAIFLLSISFGAVPLSLSELMEALMGRADTVVHQIVWNFRLPRTLVSLMVGSALALSGCILQAIMRNPLATPNIIGVSSGAGLSAYTIMIIFPQYYTLVPMGAFVGALLATLFIYTLAWRDGIVTHRLVLAGVAVSSILSAGNNILLWFYPDRVSGVINFMIGGLSGTNWRHVKMVYIYILIALLITWLFRDKLNLLVLGDDVATSLGVPVERLRRLFIVLSSILAGAAVSVVGLLGFVGLIVPHMARFFVGSDYRINVPAVVLLGGIVLMSADLISRLVFAPVEIPVGIVMSLIGGPFFLSLLRRRI